MCAMSTIQQALMKHRLLNLLKFTVGRV